MVASFRLSETFTLSSTNDAVKRAIEVGEPEGFAVRADVQTAGYGRQGRSWASPAGGLYLSLLLRPSVEPRRLPTLSVVTALAVRRALASFVSDGDAIFVKWPNDVVIPLDAPEGAPSPEGAASCGRAAASGKEPDAASASPLPVLYRKLAGISHELHAGALCVGIGANVQRPLATGAAQVGGKNEPAYLCELPRAQQVGAREVARAVLDAFAPLYDRWQRDGVESLLVDYERHAFLTGRTVRVETRDGSLLAEGLVRGIDAEARLLLEVADGSLLPVASGEAHLVL